MRADIAIITILPEEYRAALATLDDGHRPYRDPTGAPNAHGWRTGTLSPAPTEGPHGPPLRVVVAMLHDAGQASGQRGTRATIERFDPRYVVMLGVAGALPERGLGLGDVVVSSVIWNYEYGKIDRGYDPRLNYTYQVDGSLLTSAAAYATLGGGWTARLTAARPDGTAQRPRFTTGAVASGDKVIDDASDWSVLAVLRTWPKLIAVEMEGAGAAVAAREATESGRETGFIMVRGISDLIPDRALEETASTGGTATRDDWKPYAASAAAAFVAGWAIGGWPVGPRTPKPAAVPPPDTTSRRARRARLATLYPHRDQTVRVLRDAGFDPNRVCLDGSAQSRWDKALDEVEKHADGLARLDAVVTAEYPS